MKISQRDYEADMEDAKRESKASILDQLQAAQSVGELKMVMMRIIEVMK